MNKKMLLTHLYPDTCHFNIKSFGYVPSAINLCLKCKTHGYCIDSNNKCQCFTCRITFKEINPYTEIIFYVAALTLKFKIFNKICISNHFGVNYNQLRDVQKNTTNITQHNLIYKKMIYDVDNYYQKYLLLKLINIIDDVTNYIQNILFMIHNIKIKDYFKILIN